MQRDLDAISATALKDPPLAMTMADAFRAGNPRAGVMDLRLPLPGRVQITGTDPTSAVVTVAGHRLPPGDARGVPFCRWALDPVDVVVDAPGCRTATVTVKPDSDPKEKVFAVAMTPAPQWVLPAPETTPAWSRLIAQGGCLVVASDAAVRVVEPVSGQVLQSLGSADIAALPQHFLWQPLAQMPGQTTLATSTGQAFVAPSDRATITPMETVRDGDAVITQLVGRSLVFNLGELGWFSVGHDSGGWQLSASCHGRAMWNQRTDAKQAPWLATDEERVVVVDDLQVRLLDQQEGHEIAKSALPAARTGTPVALDDARLLLMPLTSGMALMRRAKDGTYAPVNVPGLSGTTVAETAAEGDAVLVATPAGELSLYRLDGAAGSATLTLAWKVPAPAGHNLVPGLLLTPTGIAVGDDAGTVRLLGRKDGLPVLTVAIPGTVAGPPLVVRDLLMVADDKGAVAAFALRH
jgi:hypothetical protein